MIYPLIVRWNDEKSRKRVRGLPIFKNMQKVWIHIREDSYQKYNNFSLHGVALSQNIVHGSMFAYFKQNAKHWFIAMEQNLKFC